MVRSRKKHEEAVFCEFDMVDLLWGTYPCQSAPLYMSNFGGSWSTIPPQGLPMFSRAGPSPEMTRSLFPISFPWTKLFSHCRINFYQLHFRRPQICSLTTWYWYSWWKKSCKFIPCFTRLYTSQVAQDFIHQHYHIQIYLLLLRSLPTISLTPETLLSHNAQPVKRATKAAATFWTFFRNLSSREGQKALRSTHYMQINVEVKYTST